jgi:hypothetical protein
MRAMWRNRSHGSRASRRGRERSRPHTFPIWVEVLPSGEPGAKHSVDWAYTSQCFSSPQGYRSFILDRHDQPAGWSHCASGGPCIGASGGSWHDSFKGPVDGRTDDYRVSTRLDDGIQFM